jgi:phage shock protein A
MKNLLTPAICFLMVAAMSSCNQTEISGLRTMLDSSKVHETELENKILVLESKLEEVKTVSSNMESAIGDLNDQIESFDYGTKKDNFDHVQDAAVAVQSAFDELQLKLDNNIAADSTVKKTRKAK